ncbi:hypothetical protein [Streptomyces sp. NPDC004629]|uniref:hypothetical protein n=1 Tax=Streptomyces sp. NPDC004629 TaxID=3364705 RepID=UPI0036C9A2D2
MPLRVPGSVRCLSPGPEALRTGLSRPVHSVRARRAPRRTGDDVRRPARRTARHGAPARGLDAQQAPRGGGPAETAPAPLRERVRAVATHPVTPFGPAVPDQRAVIHAEPRPGRRRDDVASVPVLRPATEPEHTGV